MPTDLARHIQSIRVANTHEHQKKEHEWVEQGPGDVLADLFDHYSRNDLVSAGLAGPQVERLLNPAGADLSERWVELEPYWDRIKLTGYGEAVRIHARELYGLNEITAKGLAAAQKKLDGYRKPGQRLKLLRDVANQDHIQVDDFCWPCLPDKSGPDFFLYDIGWAGASSGRIDFANLAEETGVTVTNLATLSRAFDALFAKYAPVAIAVKSQHAYSRTLAWRERSSSDAAAALAAVLDPTQIENEEARLCLGDWCIQRAAELAGDYRLPFKIHTGYYAGNNYMRTHRIPATNLCDLIARHPQTRFVLMHISYPYTQEVTALAKHFSNAFVDLCWAWSIDPFTSMDFVRRFIHTAPINKLFGFGGDCFWPTRGVAYCIQMRQWITRSLQAEVDEDLLSEAEAIRVADRLLRENQIDVFDLDAKRAAIRRLLT